MFVHMNTVDHGLNGLGPGSMGLLAPILANATQPIILAPSITANVSGGYEGTADFYSLIGSMKVPVWLRIALAPAPTRSTAALAVAHGKAQIDSLIAIMQGYGLATLLQGFALNNLIVGTKYNDNSQLTREQINDLIDYVHAKLLPVAAFVDPAIDALSPFTPDEPRYPGTHANNVLVASSLGRSIYADWLIHINPIFPWHHYDPNLPELTLDIARMASTLTLMQQYTSSTLRHGIVQAFPLDPSPNMVSLTYDGAVGSTLDHRTLERLNRVSVFLETLGIHDYCFTPDAAYGALTRSFLSPFLYMGTNTMVNSTRLRPGGISGVSLSTINGRINVMDGSTPVATFDETFKKLTLTSEYIA